MSKAATTGTAGNVLWALSDNLGTIRDIADLSGSTTSITNHRRFSAFGKLASETNAAVDMLFAFTGKLLDENTGLQDRQRIYIAGRSTFLVNQDLYALPKSCITVDPRPRLLQIA